MSDQCGVRNGAATISSVPAPPSGVFGPRARGFIASIHEDEEWPAAWDSVPHAAFRHVGLPPPFPWAGAS